MDIIYKDYKIVPESNAPGKFNLKKKVKRKKKDSSEEYEDFADISFGTDFSTCLKKIVFLELEKDQAVVTVEFFIDKFEETLKKVNSILKN